MGKRKLWSYKVGPHGGKVTAAEETRGGEVVLKCTHPSGSGYARESLGYTVRDADGKLDEDAVKAAKAAAADLSNRLLQGERPRRGAVRLGKMFDAFRRHELPHKSETRQKRLKADLEGLENYLGRSFTVSRFGGREWTGWIRDRAAGKVDARGQRVADPEERTEVSPRTAGKALRTLRQVCRWAEGWRRRDGTYLLEKDPTKGFTLPRNDNIRRPMYDDAEVAALLEVAPRVMIGRADRDPDERSPLKELLVLAAGTGRRIGAIVALKWGDWRPEKGTYGRLRFRAEEDKIGREWTVPVTPQVREALESRRNTRLATHGVPGDEAYIFPAPDSEGHVRVDVARGWLKKAEELAEGVEHVKGRGWHGLRRRWASKRKHLSLRDVAFAGGWADTQTLQRCYQRPDEETVEEVVLAGRNLRVNGAN